jgi:hypothetical protein
VTSWSAIDKDISLVSAWRQSEIAISEDFLHPHLVNGYARKLEGEYWTQRPTTGTVTLTFHTKDMLDEMPSDLPAHPMSIERPGPNP